jgi:hypothetical protein
LHRRDAGNWRIGAAATRSRNKALEMDRNSLLTKACAFVHFIHNGHKNESRSAGKPRHHAALASNILNKLSLLHVQFLIAKQKTL